MANTVPAGLIGVDSANLLAGASLASSAVSQLGTASNSVIARIGSGTPRISQVWPRLGSSVGGNCTLDYRLAAATVAQWRIPPTRGATSVDCYIYGRSNSAAGAKYKFHSGADAAGTGWLNFSTTASLHGPHSLTIDASGVYETVYLGLDGATNHCLVDAVLVTVPPLPSPLSAGSIDGMTAIDASELGVDEPLSSDVGRRILTTAGAARDVPHVYWSWSGVDDVHGTTRSEYMRSAPHVMTALVWPDTDRESWDCTVYVLGKVGAYGAGNKFRIHASGSWLPGYRETLTLTINAGAANWQTGTIRLPMHGRSIKGLGGAVRDIYSVTLTVWPVMSADGAIRSWQARHLGQESDLTICDVQSLAVWGR